MPAPPDTLNGWKEIGAFFGKDKRTVQRWERALGLPVHRMQGGKGSIIFAHRAELEAWREGRADLFSVPEDDVQTPGPAVPGAPTPDDAGGPDSIARRQDPLPETPDEPATVSSESIPATLGLPPVRRRRSFWFAFASCAFLLAAPALWQVSRARAPEEFRIVDAELRALDHGGKLVWSRPLGAGAVGRTGQDGPWADTRRDDAVAHEDLDGNGTRDVLVRVSHRDSHGGLLKTDQLLAFAHDGKPLWSVTNVPTLQCGDGQYSGPWRISDIVVSGRPGPRTVWVAYQHGTWWPSLVFEIGPDGARRVRFFQTGWVRALAEWHSPEGHWLAVGGVSNHPEQASISLVALDDAPAASPDATGPYRCEGMPTVPPRRVVFLPRSDASAAEGNPYALVEQLRVWGDDLLVEFDSFALLATVTPSGRVTGILAGDWYWQAHRNLEIAGRLDHSAESCPFKVSPQPIKEWTPETGWNSYLVPPRLAPASTLPTR